MGPKNEKSSLKRGRASVGEQNDIKKPRRSQRISSQTQHHVNTPISKKGQLPSPMTHEESTAASDAYKEGTVTPPEGRPSQIRQQTPQSSPAPACLSSPPSDTQVFSQFIFPPRDLEPDDEDHDLDGTWGYLFPLDHRFGGKLTLRKRNICPAPIKPLEIAKLSNESGSKNEDDPLKDEQAYEENKMNRGFPSGGYLIGRHPECDVILDMPTVSNRHCLIFNEHRNGHAVSILEDLSSNGTFVNEALVGRNKRRELHDGDEIAVLDEARFVFRYPQSKSDQNAFRQQYRLLQQLGRGHFATVYLCIEKATGFKFAVKKFERRQGDSQKSQTEGLQQEIAVLMSVSHPNVLCLKDTFDEADGVYLVLELASEGELFNWIVLKQKLTEDETRKVFIQLFQGIKYLHERNIVHRDIKPENILLTDKNLSVKLADFGLAKIIGEESFTTTLCGTPSYVAPEILENSRHRKYTRAVDVWSLGVVLYICLCGFPPFSDELYTPENPYTLSQQIKMGRFDYPSPYWDSVGDPALDLIDKMLTVDVEKRITVDECLEHPWITGSHYIDPADSTDGLTGRMGELDFSKRKMQRERTLLSSINNVRITQVVDLRRDDGKGERPSSPSHFAAAGPGAKATHVKVFEKNGPARVKPRVHNAHGKKTPNKGGQKATPKEDRPADERATSEFMNMGGKGDLELFGNDADSKYTPVPKRDANGPK